MLEQDLAIVEIGLSELEHRSGWIVDSDQFTVWNGVVVVADVLWPGVNVL